MSSLLTEPIIPVESRGERAVVTLPHLLAQLGRDDVDSFVGLAPHQAQSWYQFLVQLGALALFRAGREQVPDDRSTWRQLLFRLTPDSADTAWSLVTDDQTQPALLQPPTALLPAFKPAADTPDRLDVLVTAKNHDRKLAQAKGGDLHLWLYALVTLQTTQGYSGRGQPGVVRMNGGLSSRVLVDRRPGPRWGPRVVRGVRMLLTRRQEILRAAPGLFRNEGGLALTWLRSWDTDEQLQVTDLDPFFIEVCRRVRLASTAEGQVSAFVRPARLTRISGRHLKGNVGDPWAPVRRKDGAALTVSGSGFDYRRVQRILFKRREFQRPLALKQLPWESGTDSEIHMAVLVRGQGKTEGLHERIIPLPKSCSAAFELEGDADEDAETLATLSEDMVEFAGETRKVLRRAVLVYLHGPEQPRFTSPHASGVVRSYDRLVDERFFRILFSSARTGLDRANLEWQESLRDIASQLVRHAWERMTPPSTRREKARAVSEALFFAGLRKHLPLAFPQAESKE
ncbi:MAG: hypothetical protein OXN89_18600 [Bryobacterales bacterium]|nr:hypothetical protein [Bryobacterales bacterium]